MSRKEATNTFTDGLITDLNPINTPNTVLTDCVNGTILTYNGNELSLQNDMGNYMLKYCKLPEYYVPVGVKEYGDILYIVSYNPLDKSVEIGSYPSPKTIKTPNEKDKGLEYTYNSIGSQINSDIDHKKIVQEMQKMHIFYGQDTKLNPGDQYRVEINDDVTACKYEELNFFVIDEDRKSTDITKNVKDDGFPSDVVDNKFKYTSWKNPGWFAIQPRFITFDEFRVNVKRVIVPNYTDNINIQLNFQWISSDNLIIEKEVCSDLFVDVIVKKDNGQIDEKINLPLNGFLKYDNGRHIYWRDFNESYNEITSNSIITIEVTPKLKVGNNYVIFSEDAKSLTFNIGQKANIKDIALGNSIWRYSTSKERLIVTFDSSGLLASSVLNNDVFLYYTVERITSSGLKIVKSQQKATSWNIIGNSELLFDLTSYNENSIANNEMVAEDVYVISFDLKTEDSVGAKAIKSFKKLVVATELMNGFDDDLYDQITFDRWISKYNDSIKNKTFSITEANLNEDTLMPDKEAVYEPRAVYDTFVNGNSVLRDFNRYIGDNLDNKTFSISAGVSGNANISCKSNITVLVGPLWDDLNTNAELQIDMLNPVIAKIDKFLGTANEINSKSVVSIRKTKEYKIKRLSEIKNLYNILNNNIIYSNTTIIKDASSYSDGNITMEVTAAGAHQVLPAKKATKNTNEPFTQEPKTAINKLINLLNTNDCLFVTVSMIFKNQNRKSYNDELHWIRSGQVGKDTDPTLITSQSFRQADATHKGDVARFSMNFIAFKSITNELIFIKCNDTEKFKNWIKGVEHIKIDKNSYINGAFYSADPFSDNGIIKDLSFTINGNLVFRTFKYCGRNMFSIADRSILNSYAPNTKNFSMSENEKNITNIPSEQLSTYIGTINANYNLTENDLEILTKAEQTIYDLNRNTSIQWNDSEKYQDLSINDYYNYKQDAELKSSSLIELFNMDSNTLADKFITGTSVVDNGGWLHYNVVWGKCSISTEI